SHVPSPFGQWRACTAPLPMSNFVIYTNVIVERSLHPDWLSNAYVIADRPGGTAIFVDSGAPLEPLFEAVERHRLNVTHLLTTHADHDHIAGDAEILARYDCPVVKALACDADHRGRAGFAGAAVSRDLETGGLSIEAL